MNKPHPFLIYAGIICIGGIVLVIAELTGLVVLKKETPRKSQIDIVEFEHAKRPLFGTHSDKIRYDQLDELKKISATLARILDLTHTPNTH